MTRLGLEAWTRALFGHSGSISPLTNLIWPLLRPPLDPTGLPFAASSTTWTWMRRTQPSLVQYRNSINDSQALVERLVTQHLTLALAQQHIYPAIERALKGCPYRSVFPTPKRTHAQPESSCLGCCAPGCGVSIGRLALIRLLSFSSGVMLRCKSSTTSTLRSLSEHDLLARI